MTDNVFVNRDKTKVVPAGSVEAKWQMPRAQAIELGLIDGDKPKQERRPAFDASKAVSPNGTQKRRSKRK